MHQHGRTCVLVTVAIAWLAVHRAVALPSHVPAHQPSPFPFLFIFLVLAHAYARVPCIRSPATTTADLRLRLSENLHCARICLIAVKTSIRPFAPVLPPHRSPCPLVSSPMPTHQLAVPFQVYTSRCRGDSRPDIWLGCLSPQNFPFSTCTPFVMFQRLLAATCPLKQVHHLHSPPGPDQLRQPTRCFISGLRRGSGVAEVSISEC